VRQGCLLYPTPRMAASCSDRTLSCCWHIPGVASGLETATARPVCDLICIYDLQICDVKEQVSCGRHALQVCMVARCTAVVRTLMASKRVTCPATLACTYE
jgi:hypothetical protein